MELVICTACAATATGEKALIAGPVGALVDVYRTRLPASEDSVPKTVHASLRIARRAGEQYVPPGRLEHFDLIILDEASRLDDGVWDKMKTACGELVKRQQPTRSQLIAVFGVRRLSKHRSRAVKRSCDIEQQRGRAFTFLMVTNGADLLRLQAQSPEAAAKLDDTRAQGRSDGQRRRLVFDLGLRV